jgi:chromosome segregation ATPase
MNIREYQKALDEMREAYFRTEERAERAGAERDELAEQLNAMTSMAEKFGQERDRLRALLRECQRAIVVGDPLGNTSRKIDAALKEKP